MLIALIYMNESNFLSYLLRSLRNHSRMIIISKEGTRNDLPHLNTAFKYPMVHSNEILQKII